MAVIRDRRGNDHSSSTGRFTPRPRTRPTRPLVNAEPFRDALAAYDRADREQLVAQHGPMDLDMRFRMAVDPTNPGRIDGEWFVQCPAHGGLRTLFEDARDAIHYANQHAIPGHAFSCPASSRTDAVAAARAFSD